MLLSAHQSNSTGETNGWRTGLGQELMVIGVIIFMTLVLSAVYAALEKVFPFLRGGISGRF